MSDTAVKKEPMKLEFKTKETFNGTIKSDFFTTTELAKKINPVFKAVFKDYHGIIIKPCTTAGIMNEMPVILELDFIPGTDNGEGVIPAFVNVGSSESNKHAGFSDLAIAALQFNETQKTANAFQITQDAVDILWDYIGGPASRRLKQNIQSFMTSGFVVETVDEKVNAWGKGTRTIHALVTSCVDLNKLLNAMMVNKDNTGSRYYYQVSPIRAIGAQAQSNTSAINYLYQVTQFSKKEMERVMEAVGATTSAISSLPIIQA